MFFARVSLFIFMAQGTRLNEIRYFRQPRPYTRMKITKIRLIPDVSVLRDSVKISPNDQILSSNHKRSCEKSRDRCLTLDRDQRSREIAFLSYTSDTEDPENSRSSRSNSRIRCRDTSVETDPENEINVWLPESADLTPEIAKIQPSPTKFESEKEIQVKLELQMEEKNIGVEESTKEFNVEIPAQPEVSEELPEVIEEEDCREKTNVRSKKNNSDNDKSFWFRYVGIRKILDFFGHLLGRRTTENDDVDVPTTTEDQNFVEKNVVNSYKETRGKKNDFTMDNRAKSSGKRKILAMRRNTTIDKPEDQFFSGLTRQIMSTKDRRLRATLIEHEMRTRKLEEENRRYRKMLQQKLRIRQMSNPLH